MQNNEVDVNAVVAALQSQIGELSLKLAMVTAKAEASAAQVQKLTELLPKESEKPQPAKEAN